MSITKLTPTLWTNDLKGTVEFYTSVLGFSCKGLELDYGWASLEKDQVSIMLSLPPDNSQFSKPLFTGSLYLFTDDANEEWMMLKDSVEVSYPIEDFEYGMREFGILDNNGYLIQFGQEI